VPEGSASGHRPRQEADDHDGAAATGAAFGSVRWERIVDRIGGRFRAQHVEEPTTERKLGGAVAVGEEAVVADAMKAVRQGVQQEAADELVGRQCHDLRAAVVTVIPPTEGDLIVGHADQACVGYGDAMGIAAEIGQHLLGVAEGWLGVDDPIDAPQLAEPACEGDGFGECRKLAEETEFAGREVGAQRVEEEPPEQPREDTHRQKEAGSAGHPARTVERWTAAGHDAMDVRVVMQVLAPGVKHGDQADLGAEMLRVGGDGAQRLGRRAQQDGIDGLLVLEGDLCHQRGSVNTTWKYGTGSSSACRAASHSAHADPWHFGQCRLRQEL
jgi:hypothetical protein